MNYMIEKAAGDGRLSLLPRVRITVLCFGQRLISVVSHN